LRFYPNWTEVSVRHAFFSAARPQVFAHRGGAALAPENTVQAFDHAVALGVDGLELDVRLSRDAVVVVHHDATLDRTTCLSGALAARSAAELSDVGVPRLDHVLRRYPRARVIVEMKVDTPGFAHAVAEAVTSAEAQDRVCVGGFGTRALRTIRNIAPDIATSAAREEVRWALYRSWCRWPLRTVPYAGYQVPQMAGRIRVVSPRFVATAHRSGLGVQVWTVNDEDTAQRLLAWGVDALITDRPDLMVPLVASMSRSR
jgi:glycerophosphoryl diester phosphodiesterase